MRIACWSCCGGKGGWAGGVKKLHTVRETLRALRDYLRQFFILVWLPDHTELVKEHLRLKGYAFDAKLTK